MSSSCIDACILPEPAATDESSTQQTFVTETLPNDVLLGRGSHLVKYKGNIEFRRLIQERKHEYVLAVRHSHKDQIAREVINIIGCRNGRFLRKVEHPNEMTKLQIPTHVVSAWVQVDTDIVVEKIKQAFRDSCKDGKSSERDHSSCAEGIQGIVASDSSKILSSKAGIDSSDADIEGNEGTRIPSLILKQAEGKVTSSSQVIESEIKKSSSIETDHFTRAEHISLTFQNQGYDGSAISQQLHHVYQQNQRRLLEHLKSRHTKPPERFGVAGATTEWSTYSDIPQSRSPDNSVYLNDARNQVQRILQAQAFQLTTQSESPMQTHQPNRHRSPHNIAAESIPMQYQYLLSRADGSAARSIVGQAQTNIYRALHRQTMDLPQSRQDHSRIIDSHDALLAMQYNASFFPVLTNCGASWRSQFSNNQRSTIELSRLLSGLSQSSPTQGYIGGNTLDSHALYTSSTSTTNLVNNLVSHPSAAVLETGDITDCNPKRSSVTDVYESGDSTLTRKKICIAKPM